MSTVAVAGSSGFVGSALIPELAKHHKVIALTRGDLPDSSGVTWLKCDLFSLLETEQALKGVDYAIYLVHSMLPSAQLTQGQFQELDLLVADNFARAAELNNLKQIIYLGGIIPANQELSSHLKSRKEVELALAGHKTPLTTLRAGMVIGTNGSSLNIVVRLVNRLPFMICPTWTTKQSRPVDLDDVVASILYLLGKADSYQKVFDLAGADKITYKEMMLEVARQLGKKLRILSVPFFTPKLSRLWITLITGAPRNLVAPLVASLKNEMLPEPKQVLDIPGRSFLGFRESLKKALSVSYKPTPRAFCLPESERRKRTVRSVQRLHFPKGKTARDIAELYIKWLPKHLSPLLKVDLVDRFCIFRLPIFNWELLRLEKAETRSSSDRQLFYIVGGALVKPVGRARMEFRTTYDNKHILVAIHDYQPTLPWYIYRLTQAILHLWVMRSFDCYLSRQEAS